MARKQREHGFPMPVKLGKRQAWFPKAEVQIWLAQRVAERDARAVVTRPKKPTKRRAEAKA